MSAACSMPDGASGMGCGADNNRFDSLCPSKRIDTGLACGLVIASPQISANVHIGQVDWRAVDDFARTKIAFHDITQGIR